MKTTWKWASIGVVLTVLIALSAPAQNTTIIMTFTTTFPFYAGNAKMPAGEYKVLQTSNTGVLSLESTSGSHSAFVEVRSTRVDQAHAQPVVTFKKYGDIYFLRRFWVGGQRSGMRVFPSKFEQTQAKQTTGTEESVPAK